MQTVKLDARVLDCIGSDQTEREFLSQTASERAVFAVPVRHSRDGTPEADQAHAPRVPTHNKAVRGYR